MERVLDNAIIIGAFFLTYRLRDALDGAIFWGMTFKSFKMLGPLQDYLLILAFAIPLYNAALSLLGAYRSMRLSSHLQILRQSLTASALVFLCLGTLMYLLKLDLSRSFLAFFSALAGVLLACERSLTLLALRFFRIRGKNFRNLLLVGTGAQARRLFFELLRRPELGIRVVGFVSLSTEKEMLASQIVNGRRSSNSTDVSSAVYDLPVRTVATADTFEAALKKFAIDEVLFTDVSSSFHQVQELAQIASEEGVGVTLAADFFSLEMLRSDISYFGDTPLLHYRSSPAESPALVAKRMIDFSFSALSLIALLPLLIIVAIAIKMDSVGPVFFRQRRVGLNGRTFTLLKFRSMVQDAEELLPVLRSRNEMRGPVFKLRNDPRVTKIGKYLRRFSIDELPQLWNVLKGDMSLVGPRPPLPEEVELYMRKQRRRLSMRPGLTCIWQVSGRNEIPDFEQWAKLDLEYIDNWSLWTDFKLLLKTIPVVLSGIGAR